MPDTGGDLAELQNRQERRFDTGDGKGRKIDKLIKLDIPPRRDWIK
jgi:hypothetical protein